MVDAYWDDELGEVQTGLVNLGSPPHNESQCQEKSVVDDSSPCSPTSVLGQPVCRQFWKAGIYNLESTPVSGTQVGSNYLHIHPKFLHSNATSHKWAFGAVAELLDNAVDEIQNGATCVRIDKTVNPRDGSSALLIQDNGSGMSPEAMRQCLSFGYSDKKSDAAIGKYGNGFKTSSMRLGADAIVFSRHIVDGAWTQSIGLLSYTFLTQSGYDRVVVPMVHYRWDPMTFKFQALQPASEEHANSNLSVLLQWSPFSTEEELLKQCESVHHRGTKFIIYNLWLDDEGKVELDFESDPEDIRIMWDGENKAKDNSVKSVRESKMKDKSVKSVSENHIANHIRCSLHAYLSILYLNLPETFSIRLRGKVVFYHNIARDLKYLECILYKSQNGRKGHVEGEVVVTLGFHKDAPNSKVHGFSIYHKRRLILPFLSVVGHAKGIVGVLGANYIEPTHNKQDFENTNVYQKLVTRLRGMSYEYWDKRCRAIGYEVPEKARPQKASPGSSRSPQTLVGCSDNRDALNGHSNTIEPVELVPCLPQESNDGSDLKRKLPDHPTDCPSKNIRLSPSVANIGSNMLDSELNPKKMAVMQENKKLKDNCLAYEKVEEQLNLKAMELTADLEEAQREYTEMFTKLQALERSQYIRVNASA